MFRTFDYGEEFIAQALIEGTLYVGLYDDDADDPQEDGDLPFPSEPDDGNYQRLTYTAAADNLSIRQNAAGNWEVYLEPQDFDLINTTGGYANGAFIARSFQATGDDAPNIHVQFTDQLTDSQGEPTRIDLEGAKSFTFSGTYEIVDPSDIAVAEG